VQKGKQMTKEQANWLYEAMENEGMECSIMPDYSGRCMYGKTTYAISCDNVLDLMVAAIREALEGSEEDSEIFERWHPSMDQLGLGVVIY